MRFTSLLLPLCFLLLFSTCREERQLLQRDSLTALFKESGVEGAILIYPYEGDYLTNDSARCRRGFLPASTYKILHTLIILESGAVTDTSETLPWDGRERSIEAWNQDHTLRSAFRTSCVPCYQRLAHRVGVDRMQYYVERANYGLMEIDTNRLDHFWLRGDSRITLFEQLDFLQRLYRGQLPFAAAHQAYVKDIMVVEKSEDYTLRGKTGWAVEAQRNLGWYVGWVERGNQPVFFVLNIEAPLGRPGFAAKRTALTRRLLKELGILN